jgi:hypothetical protein
MPSRSKTGAKTVNSEEDLGKLIRGDKGALAERAAKGGNMPAGHHPQEAEIAKNNGLTVEQVRELNQKFKEGEKKAKQRGDGSEHGAERKEGEGAAPWYTRSGSSFYGLLMGGSSRGLDAGGSGMQYVPTGGSGGEAGSPLEEAIQKATSKNRKGGPAKPSAPSAPPPSYSTGSA